MEIETFIKNEAMKYKNKADKNKQQGVDLDKLEKWSRQHIRNCYDFISEQEIYLYSDECKYKKLAEETIESVDRELFGCFNNGKCLGYDFYKRD